MDVPEKPSSGRPAECAPSAGLLRPLDRTSPWLSVGIGLGATGLALLVRLFLTPFIGSEAPFAVFLVSVLVAAWYGGLFAGLSASVLGSVLGTWLYLQRLAEQEYPGPTHEYLWFGLGLAIGGGITEILPAALRPR